MLYGTPSPGPGSPRAHHQDAFSARHGLKPSPRHPQDHHPQPAAQSAENDTPQHLEAGQQQQTRDPHTAAQTTAQGLTLNTLDLEEEELSYEDIFGGGGDHYEDVVGGGGEDAQFEIMYNISRHAQAPPCSPAGGVRLKKMTVIVEVRFHLDSHVVMCDQPYYIL